MISAVFSHLRALRRTVPPVGVPGVDAQVAQAYADGLSANAPAIDRGFLLFIPLAVVCLLEIGAALQTPQLMVWLVVFLGAQVMPLVLHQSDGLGFSERTRLLLSAAANVLPFGLLSFLAMEHSPQAQYLMLTGTLACVVPVAMVACPGFVELHRIYNAGLVLPLALGWLGGDHAWDGAMGMLMLALFVLQEALSRHLHKRHLQSIGIELAHETRVQELQGRIEAMEAQRRHRASNLAAACHDLMQPTHAMGMMLEVQWTTEPDARRRESLRQMQKVHALSAGMLSALMEPIQLDSGAVQVARVSIAMRDVLEEARLQFGMAAQQKGLALVIPRTDMHVYSDPYLLRRVIFNLLSNGIKYTNEGEVEVTLRRAGDRLLVSVRDTGIGIPPSWQPQMFNEYTRADREVEGTGIGLFIVKKACSLMGHPLTFDSALGVGSSFTIELELAEAQSHEPAGVETMAEIDAAHQANGKPRLVALIEDDATIRQAAVELLRQWGFGVIDAEDAPELIGRIQASPEKPSLMLADLHLRSESGFAAIQGVRTLPGLMTMPAIILTGDTSPEFQQMADSDHVLLLHKPVSPSRLRKIIDGMMA